MISVPVMSLGIRSGVNWMRENLRSSTLAIVLIRSVLASPGTPMIRLFAPVNSESSTRSITPSWPTMSFRSSALIWSHATLSRSAWARSSDDSRAGLVAIAATGILGWRSKRDSRSVRERVDQVVDAQLVRFVRLTDRNEPRCRELPEVRDVRIEIHDHHQALLGIV